MNNKVVAVVLAMVVTTGYAARILAVFPAPSRSHKQLYSPLLAQLASRGHHLTVISPFEEKYAGNVTAIRIVLDTFSQQGNYVQLLSHPNIFIKMFYLFALTTRMMDMILSSPDVAQFIESTDQRFDLVITLQAGADALLAFGRRFNAPVITVCTTLGIPWVEDMIGNELNPSYVPDTFLSYSDHMSFYERSVNFLFSTYNKLIYRFYVIPKQTEMVRKHFRNVEVSSSVLDLYSDVSVNFINIVPGINYPRPLTPDMVPVGGLHILTTNPLPQDMKKFLDESTEGAILFSLGTNVRSADLSTEKREIILKVFSKLKQRVVWKFETDDLDALPVNVKIWKWLPQNDVLAHRNMKAFITHGGLLSSQEAMYHGVPVLVIPFFADQLLNAQYAQNKGIGVIMQLSALTEAFFNNALHQLLYNTSYREKAKEMSRIFRDQPQSALERAVFWVEYVLRHKGAPHLRSAAAGLAWYQRYLLDVIAVLVLAAVTVLYCALLLCRRLFCASGKRTVANEKKNT